MGLLSIPDKEKNYYGYILFVLNNIWSITIAIIVTCGVFYFPEIAFRWYTLMVLAIAIGLFIHYLNYKGKTKIGSKIFIVLLWLIISIPCITAGGIKAPGIISQVSVILTAGFLLSSSAGFIVGIVTIIFDFVLSYMEVTGSLPEPIVKHTPISSWIGSIIPFGTIIALQHYSTNHLRNSLNATKREFKLRLAAEIEKDNTLFLLRERIKELNGLIQVSQVLQRKNISIDDAIKEILQIIPSAWQFPEFCAVAITIDKKRFLSNNYKEIKYRQNHKLIANIDTVIDLEVAYTNEFPNSVDEPFLNEEKKLLVALTEMIKIYLERNENLKELNDYKNAINWATIVSITDESDKFIYVSDNFSKASKYHKDEILGQHWSIINSGLQSDEYFVNITKELSAGRYFRGEFCNKNKLGEIYWLDATIVPFLNEEGNIIKLLTIGHDITERKKSADQLIKSEAFLRKTTSHVPGNTYVFTLSEKADIDFIFTNKGTEPFNHNIDSSQLIENPELLLNKVHEDDKERFNITLLKAQQTKEFFTMQYRFKVNGNIRWRWMQAYPEKNEDGVVVWYGSSSDITPLIDHILSIEQFIYDLSHVIRKPIANLIGLSDIIKHGNLSDDEITDFCNDISIASKELDAFVYELHNAYLNKKSDSFINIDFGSLVDKRGSFFKS
ncbi:MAG: PAS domain-containing protein [Sediminibacterium sp.]|uniref:PAS domain-containing protein n=1 Tax=Sediminibacterium sp. TaxID=1917865 RepID=UPI0027270FBA|nr:PAS domain-containing protein [Sediminibacterium sp.]MDO8998017.1 PAS domain-containing protein [Sediminibacterium sp.]